MKGLKTFKKVLFTIIGVLYFAFALCMTILLLNRNNYNVTQFGDTSLIIISDEVGIEGYEKGDLVIVDKSQDVFTGDKAFFYDTYNRQIEVRLGEVVDLERVTQTEQTFTFEGDHKVSSEYVLGGVNGASVMPGVGTVLNVLESKWGFLFLIVLPALIAFLYQITVVVSELKGNKEEKE